MAGPVIDSFDPTWVLVSAGYDAHRADPMADLRLTSGDFALLARCVSDYAPVPGRVVMFLEGGYDLGALRSSIHASLSAALGNLTMASPLQRRPGTEQIERMRQSRRSTVEMLHASDDEESTQ